MTIGESAEAPAEGVRARKRRETLKRITDVAVRLFLEKGIEATTLDEIAAAAGISRRTFFYYFDSKDDILLAMQSSTGTLVAAALADAAPDKRPIDAVREAILAVTAHYPADEMIALDRLMRSSAAVQARKQASYVEHERAIFAALRERWPDPARETALRLVAMLAIGAVRLSLETLSREEGKRPLPELLNEAFDALETEL